MNPAVLVVDPILRASRLVYSTHAIKAFLREGWTTHLLTRREPPTAHYRELLGESPHQLHATIPLPPNFWYGKLSPAAIRCCLAEIERLRAGHGVEAAFFSGWDEFYPALPLRVWGRSPLRRLPCLAVDYSPGYWVKPAPQAAAQRLKNVAKRLTVRLALRRFAGLHLLVLDERVLAADASALPARLRDRYSWIPDPPPFAAPIPAAAPPAGKPAVLIVGLQTERKGLIDVIELLERGGDWPVRFHLVGRLAPETEPLRDRVRALAAAGLTWMEGFFPEEEIQRQYAAADFVILPYTRQFDCSSAVLATACGHGKPVITTDHGVIGLRVRRGRLGFTYPSRDAAALAGVIRGMPLPGGDEYTALSARGRVFAEANSIARFQEILTGLIRGAIGRGPA